MTDFETNELDQLAAAAAAVDNMTEQGAPGADLPGASGEVHQADQSDEVAALLLTVSGLLAPMFPSLAGIYTRETCASLGKAAAPVLAKYELSVGGLFDRWGAEIALLGVALPVGLATVQAISADLEAKKAKPERPAPAPGANVEEGGHAASGVFSMGEG